MDYNLIKLLDDLKQYFVGKNADIVVARLLLKNVLSQGEGQLMDAEKLQDKKFVILVDFLKSKNNNAWMHLQQVFLDNGWEELLAETKSGLINAGFPKLILKEAPTSALSTSTCDDVENRIVSQLKKHYKEDSEYMIKYWKKFGVDKFMNMDTFYCYDIEILNKTFDQSINSFEDLFALDINRCGIVADAGYGKSTFIHQMAREWTRGTNQKDEKVLWVEKFKFLFLFRIGDISSVTAMSLIDLIKSVLPLHLGHCDKKEKNEYCITCEITKFLKDETNLMDDSLFIFDGLDEQHVQFGYDVLKMLEGSGLQRYHIIITSRSCDSFEKLAKSPAMFLRLGLKGFSENGVKSQLKKFGKFSFFGKINEMLKIPLYLTIACIIKDDQAINLDNCCAFVERFVDHSLITFSNREEILSTAKIGVIWFLGEKALRIFKFVKMNKLSDLDDNFEITPVECLKIAIHCGLVQKNSYTDTVNFVHQTIAEYCAAVYLLKCKHQVDYETTEGVQLLIQNGLDLRHSFSRMLSYLSLPYKKVVWCLARLTHTPLLDDYKTLPMKFMNERNIIIFLSGLPIADEEKCNIMNHLSFSNELVRNGVTKMQIIGSVFDDEKTFIGNTTCVQVIFNESKFLHGTQFIYDKWSPQEVSFHWCEISLHNDLVEVPLNMERLQKFKITNCTNDNYFIKTLSNIFSNGRCRLKELVVLSTNAVEEFCKNVLQF